MGCFPLCKKIFRAVGNCNGKEGKPSSRRVAILSPPPSYSRTVSKSVNISKENPVVIISSDPNPTVSLTPPIHSSSSTAQESSRLRFDEPNRVRSNATGSPRVGPVHQQATPVQREPPQCYVMSPLPRWEERPRRKEYFSREYYYYPTPIREGIYSFAADPNRLTAIFSEENPNACTIV